MIGRKDNNTIGGNFYVTSPECILDEAERNIMFSPVASGSIICQSERLRQITCVVP